MITDTSVAKINSQIIVTLAKQALHNLPYHQQYHQAYTESGYRKEFGTVKIALPRQSGHSTAALQIMYEYPDALCFVPNRNSRTHLRQLLTEYTDDPAIHARLEKAIMLPDQDQILRIPPQWERSFVIIDQASSTRNEIKNYILESLQASIILELQ